MVIFFNFTPTLNHPHPLQVENCDNNSRLVVDEDDNVKSGLKGLKGYCYLLYYRGCQRSGLLAPDRCWHLTSRFDVWSSLWDPKDMCLFQLPECSHPGRRKSRSQVCVKTWTETMQCLTLSWKKPSRCQIRHNSKYFKIISFDTSCFVLLPETPDFVCVRINWDLAVLEKTNSEYFMLWFKKTNFSFNRKFY